MTNEKAALREQMKQQLRPLNMAKETIAEAGALVGSRNQPRDIGDHKSLKITEVDNAQIWLQSSEGIIRDLWSCCRDSRYEGRLSRIWTSHKAHIG